MRAMTSVPWQQSNVPLRNTPFTADEEKNTSVEKENKRQIHLPFLHGGELDMYYCKRYMDPSGF